MTRLLAAIVLLALTPPAYAAEAWLWWGADSAHTVPVSAANPLPVSGAGAQLGTANTWTAAQRGAPSILAISTATFTPSFDAANNFALTLVHAACPCTLANPSTTPVAGQSGIFQIAQSATGADTIGTWGSLYVTAGGTSTITLSTGASVSDLLPYYVQDATHIVLGSIIAGPTH